MNCFLGLKADAAQAPSPSSSNTAPLQAAPSGVAVTASSVSSPNSVPSAPSVTASSVTSPNASVSSPSVVSSVSSPSASSSASVVSSVTPVGVTVKPLDLTAGQIAGVKKILQDIYSPAMSLADNAELSEKETQLLLDEIEARSQQEMANQTAAMYLRTGQCASAGACQKKAEEDVKAIFEYQNVMGMSQEDRIKMNADLAVGLYTGATNKDKFEGIRHDAAWTVNTVKACEKNGQLGADCNKLNALAKSGAYKPGGKMDLANRANSYLGKESKALVNGAENTAIRHINRGILNYCQSLERVYKVGKVGQN